LPVPHCQHHYHYCHQMQPVLALFCEVSRQDDGRATTNLHRARVTCVPSLHSQTQQLQINPTQQTQSPASAAVLTIDTHTSTRKVKPTWILLEQETVSGSSISWAVCKSVPRSRQITTLAPHCSVTFYRPDALPAAQRPVSKHWGYISEEITKTEPHLGTTDVNR